MDSSVLKLEPKFAFYFTESSNDVMASLEVVTSVQQELIQQYLQSLCQSMLPRRYFLLLRFRPTSFVEFCGGWERKQWATSPMRVEGFF